MSDWAILEKAQELGSRSFLIFDVPTGEAIAETLRGSPVAREAEEGGLTMGERLCRRLARPIQVLGIALCAPLVTVCGDRAFWLGCCAVSGMVIAATMAWISGVLVAEGKG